MAGEDSSLEHGRLTWKRSNRSFRWDNYMPMLASSWGSAKPAFFDALGREEISQKLPRYASSRKLIGNPGTKQRQTKRNGRSGSGSSHEVRKDRFPFSHSYPDQAYLLLTPNNSSPSFARAHVTRRLEGIRTLLQDRDANCFSAGSFSIDMAKQRWRHNCMALCHLT